MSITGTQALTHPTIEPQPHKTGSFTKKMGTYLKPLLFLGLLVTAPQIGFQLAGGPRHQTGTRFLHARPIEKNHLEEMTATLRQVGQTLQYKDANNLKIHPKTTRTQVGEDNVVELSQEDYESFFGKGPLTREEVIGIFSHEISHLIQDHIVKGNEFETALKYNNSVNGIPPSFFHDDATQNQIDEDQRIMQNKINEYSQQREREADLYPVPYSAAYARGLRDALAIHSALTPDHNQPLTTHPKYQERVEYLTESICRIHPLENRDICQFKWLNSIRDFARVQMHYLGQILNFRQN